MTHIKNLKYRSTRKKKAGASTSIHEGLINLIIDSAKEINEYITEFNKLPEKSIKSKKNILNILSKKKILIVNNISILKNILTKKGTIHDEFIYMALGSITEFLNPKDIISTMINDTDNLNEFNELIELIKPPTSSANIISLLPPKYSSQLLNELEKLGPPEQLTTETEQQQNNNNTKPTLEDLDKIKDIIKLRAKLLQLLIDKVLKSKQNINTEITTKIENNTDNFKIDLEYYKEHVSESTQDEILLNLIKVSEYIKFLFSKENIQNTLNLTKNDNKDLLNKLINILNRLTEKLQ